MTVLFSALMSMFGPSAQMQTSWNQGQCFESWNLMYTIGPEVSSGVFEIKSANVPEQYQRALFKTNRRSIHQGMTLPNGTVRIVSLTPTTTWAECDAPDQENQ